LGETQVFAKPGLKLARNDVVSLPVEPEPAQVLSFETALERLEGIVESMESGDVALADLLARFEEGNQLLKVCETRLKDAELKIELLKKQKDGGARLVSFESERSES